MPSSSAVTHLTHIREPSLQQFLSPEFSPLDYLNATLPSPSPLSTSKIPPTSLSALASQTQSHVSTLTAQSTRLSETLNTLTDEILRASPRLAYDVELLRGEALSLSDSLNQPGSLHAAFLQFMPQDLEAATNDSLETPHYDKLTSQALEPPRNLTAQSSHNSEQLIAPLRTLLHVRTLLTSVTQTFSLALSWPFPPSLLPGPSSSLISVSLPADPTLEAKGQAACSRLRYEIADLLSEDAGLVDGKNGLQRATERVRELKDCVRVWKGTGEEKARGKFVDGLEALVEEEWKRRQGRQGGGKGVGPPVVDNKKRAETTEVSGGGDGGVGPGFLRNLQRLREEIYME